MKRVLTLIVLVGLFTVIASADPYELQEADVLNFTNISTVAPDTVGALLIYNGPLDTDPITPGNQNPYAPMRSGAVGFAASLSDGADLGTTATATIDAGNNAGLSGTFDGIKSYFQNDNDDFWSVQLFFIDSLGFEHNSGAFVALAGGGGTTYLTAPGVAVDLATILDVGFRVQGNMVGPDLFNNPSQGDAFHVSLVPVPGAVLLGMLGLSAAGIKLRRRV